MLQRQNLPKQNLQSEIIQKLLRLIVNGNILSFENIIIMKTAKKRCPLSGLYLKKKGRNFFC